MAFEAVLVDDQNLTGFNFTYKGSADVVQAGNFGAIRTFAQYATEEQKSRFLPDLLAGKAVMSVAMTEPDAGSAVTELTTRAVADGDGFRIGAYVDGRLG